MEEAQDGAKGIRDTLRKISNDFRPTDDSIRDKYVVALGITNKYVNTGKIRWRDVKLSTDDKTVALGITNRFIKYGKIDWNGIKRVGNKYS